MWCASSTITRSNFGGGSRASRPVPFVLPRRPRPLRPNTRSESNRENGRIADAMHRRFETATPDERAEEAIDRLRSCGCNAMPVVRGRELLGVLTLDNIGEYVMIRTALGGERRPVSVER